MKRDIPLDQAIALVRGAQKLNCDTADELHEAMARRVRENVELRAAATRARDLLRRLLKAKKLGVEYAAANAICHEITDALKR